MACVTNNFVPQVIFGNGEGLSVQVAEFEYRDWYVVEIPLKVE